MLQWSLTFWIRCREGLPARRADIQGWCCPPVTGGVAVFHLWVQVWLSVYFPYSWTHLFQIIWACLGRLPPPFFFFKIYLFNVCKLHCCSLQTYQEKVLDPITDGCEPLCGCLELNSGPLGGQSVLLTTELISPAPPYFIFDGGKNPPNEKFTPINLSEFLTMCVCWPSQSFTAGSCPASHMQTRTSTPSHSVLAPLLMVCHLQLHSILHHSS